MTGTASTESAEFSSTYDLAVTVVPTNRVRQMCICSFTGACADCACIVHTTRIWAHALLRAAHHRNLRCPLTPSVGPGRLQPTLREDAKDVVFATEEYKWKAVVQEIKHMHKSGRPVLVGTTSVERSEVLAEQLDGAGIKYQVCHDVQRLPPATT